MRVGVNALYLIPGGVGGTEIYLRHLLRGLAKVDRRNEYVVFTNRETDAGLVPQTRNFRIVPQAVRAGSRPARILWEQTALPLSAARQGVDVLFNPGFTAPFVAGCPSVTVFHDLQHKRHPEYFRWFDLPAWRFFLWGAAHLSRLLLADSEPTRTDLLRYYRLRPEKVRTVPLGVDPAFFEIGRKRAAGAGKTAKPYILCASTLHPHKNLVRLVRAFVTLARRRPDLSLVITGVRGFHTEAVELAVKDAELGDRIRLTGWVPREELYTLFRDAHAFVYPSLFEGFGMPVVEAMAAGLPTACSAVEPVRSIAANGALCFDPNDTVAMIEALDAVTTDDAVRARLMKAGPIRARAFSWERTAELTLKALREAARK
jgi:glycosyltransferase involved in cell wall biosynthesis